MNTLNMRLILVKPGSFLMGESQSTPSERFKQPPYLEKGDYDEHPVHRVTISQPFYISDSEVTIEQFRQFRPDYEGSERHAPYASGISWYDAQAFCNWLSQKEGKLYRLPTEAEWEFACRAGTSGLFFSGDSIPSSEARNTWGIKNMHTNVAEWCWDWYGPYPDEAQIDPVGPAQGFAKVVRGGGLDSKSAFYARSANRAGIAPNFPPIALEKMQELLIKSDSSTQSDSEIVEEKPEGFQEVYAYRKFMRDVLNNQGNHSIGFRVVQASMPDSKAQETVIPFVRQCVKQGIADAKTGSDPQKPYFRKRFLLPTPPENTLMDALDLIQAAGFAAGILRHHHSPALEVCPNGDVLAIYYTAVEETTPNVALIASRLRFGSEQWDMPELFLDFPDVDDHAPMLWNDNDTLRFFWGANKLDSGFPFQWFSSTDNGATWSDVQFPVFETRVGPHSAQPITSAFRDNKGTIYVASDGDGPASVLWISRNNGKTWLDPGGRSGGRHTAFALLKDSRILGMGGKSSDINGYMPKSISEDGGRTWKISATPFCALGSNQRPTIIRLNSGRLFFAGDFQHRSGAQPEGFSQRGAYVALSGDEGETWHIKKLPGAQEHEDPARRKDLRGATLGYAVARQAPNGMIHLITSMNEPCLHFELNEAWILQPARNAIDENKLMRPTATTISGLKDYKEYNEDGSLRTQWRAGIGNDGCYLLHDDQIWFYKNGQKQWQVSYRLGRKTGTESYWTQDAILLWQWNHHEDGSSTRVTFWPNGQKKTESTWRNMKCVGQARQWNQKGQMIRQVEFTNGVPVNINTNY